MMFRLFVCSFVSPQLYNIIQPLFLLLFFFLPLQVPQSEMEISKEFKLKFVAKDGLKKKFRKGEWIGLYQLKTRDNGTVVEPDDHDILHRTCYKQVTATDRERGWINWHRDVSPDRPGLYQFRYFGSRTDKKKWGTSEPLPFKFKCPSTETLVDAAMLMTSLQPVAHELAQLTAIIHEESLVQVSCFVFFSSRDSI